MSRNDPRPRFVWKCFWCGALRGLTQGALLQVPLERLPVGRKVAVCKDEIACVCRQIHQSMFDNAQPAVEVPLAA